MDGESVPKAMECDNPLRCKAHGPWVCLINHRIGHTPTFYRQKIRPLIALATSP